MREFPRNARGLRGAQMQRLSGAFEARQQRPGSTYAFGLGAGSQGQPGVLPVRSPDSSDVQIPSQSSSDTSSPRPMIVPSNAPWLLSIGREPFPVRVERFYTNLMQLPQRSLTIAQDFILTDIVAARLDYLDPVGQTSWFTLGVPSNVNVLPLPNTWEMNIYFNRRALFSDPIPMQMIPQAPYSLQMPCPYYLPKGTEITLDGLTDQLFYYINGTGSANMNPVYWLGFSGYYVVEAPPRAVLDKLARPMFYVKRFDLTNVTGVTGDAQVSAIPTDRAISLFEMNRLMEMTLELHTINHQPGGNNPTLDVQEILDLDATIPVEKPEFSYGVYPRSLSNLLVADIFSLQDRTAPSRLLWGNYRFPRYLSPPVRVCGGTTLQVNFSDTWLRDYSCNRYEWFVIGGKHLYD